jgi:hypothetical protein
MSLNTCSFSSFLENRFVLCVGCGAVCSLLLWFGKLSDGSYLAIILATVGAYVTGGVVESRAAIQAQVATAKDQP